MKQEKVYKIISSSSRGNAVIYFNQVLVDLGVSYLKISKYKKDLKIVLLTHIHKDHFNEATIKKLAYERPTLLWGVPLHLKTDFEKLGIKNNVIYLNLNSTYKLGEIMISTFKLYHNVDNVGYRIINTETDYKIFHATDTYTLDGITAKNYDLYAIEHNYDEETIHEIIFDKLASGEFSYERQAINNHLSFQQAKAFINKNKKKESEILKLHISSRYEKEC